MYVAKALVVHAAMLVANVMVAFPNYRVNKVSAGLGVPSRPSLRQWLRRSQIIVGDYL